MRNTLVLFLSPFTLVAEPPRPDGTIPEPVTEKAIQASYSAAIEHGVEFKSVGPSLPPPKVRAQPSFFPLVSLLGFADTDQEKIIGVTMCLAFCVLHV